ncbi:MAG TPA: hypothetical protein VJ810_16035 [Blastocatellia bacterium]|nr:hypothetical protein [Blastocatellia bacterium]
MKNAKKVNAKKKNASSSKKSHARDKQERAPSSSRRARRPVKITGKKIEAFKRDGNGPIGWLLPTMESSYTRLAPRGAMPQPPIEMSLIAESAPVTVAVSSLQPSNATVLAPAGPTVWRDIFLEYKRRKAAAAAAAPPAATVPLGAAAPFVPGARNWLPLGPSVVLEGQTVDNQPVAGRVVGLAVAPGGNVIYAATANGGVFRSNDGGTTWRSMMDRFDLDPTNFASASLVCGAIAIDITNPQRIYVGTGEGDTLQLFRSRITNSLPGYRGVGPIRSDDGGQNWESEPSTPDLAGEAFFALAVDPRDRENVVGATTQGLYRRAPRAGGDFEWVRALNGVYSSVVVTSDGGATRFFSAKWGQSGSTQGIFHSDDGGITWAQCGNGFPTSNAGRISLGVQANNPNLVYAVVAHVNGTLQGVYRLDGISGSWKKVNNVPNILPGAQGDYDLAIAVDPSDPNLIYLGGDRLDTPPFPGSIWRCLIQATGGGYRVKSSESIGSHAHADVHVLTHTPGDSTELWCGCDGGVFLNRDPQKTGQFAGQNNGLACLCCNFLGQHPTDPTILFSGLQDNGTARTSAGPIWSHVNGGDGGYCLTNWANPDQVLVFANGSLYRSTNGGASHDSWSTEWDFPWATMTQPIVGPPFNPANPSDAKLVAVGAGDMVFLSDDFAASWDENFTIPGGAAAGQIFALTFASPTRLYIGTTRAHVFRADRSGNTWTLARLDDVAAGPIGLDGLITDIAIDWADPTLSSVYISFGGMGDRRRVWWFGGSKWEVRSGPAGGNNLLDVEHNALTVDRLAPNNVYVGADIGVWHSSDGGRNWNPLQNGLPDAPVFDLQIHPTQRLLRAATHGRGVFEIPIG